MTGGSRFYGSRGGEVDLGEGIKIPDRDLGTRGSSERITEVGVPGEGDFGMSGILYIVSFFTLDGGAGGSIINQILDPCPVDQKPYSEKGALVSQIRRFGS